MKMRKNNSFACVILSLSFIFVNSVVLAEPKVITCNNIFSDSPPQVPFFIEQLKKMGLSLIPKGHKRGIKTVNTTNPLLLSFKLAVSEIDPETKKKWLDFIEKLIKNKFIEENQININDKDELENTVLHYAVTLESKKLIKMLLEKGANPLSKNEINSSPFELAISRSHSNISSFPMDPTDNSTERLDFFMVDHIQNINIQDIYGNSLLMIVANSFGGTSVALYLIDKKINIHLTNNPKETALLIALKNKKLKLTHRLIDEGADINAYDDSEMTPLMLAVLGQHVEVVSRLAPKVDDINFQSTVTNERALDLATATNERVFERALDIAKSPKIIDILIQNGAIKKPNKNNMLLFQRATNK